MMIVRVRVMEVVEAGLLNCPPLTEMGEVNVLMIHALKSMVQRFPPPH